MNTKTDKATPRPWKLDRVGVNITDASPGCYTVANAHGSSVGELEANAALIVQAVNLYSAHELLAKAAESLIINRFVDMEGARKWAEMFRKDEQVDKPLLALYEALSTLNALRQ